MSPYLLRRRTALATVLTLTACGAPACSSTSSAPATGPASGPAVANPFDALYDPDFTLSTLSDEPVAPLSRPERATGLEQATVDPTYGTLLYRATDAADSLQADGSARMRHEYSRRQAFNADNTRHLAQDGSGAWHLYDSTTFAHLAVLTDLVGDCEPLWHASDPRLLRYTGRNGSTTWRSLDVDTGRSELLFDFADATPWPEAASYWTKGEGTTSADGRYLALMATTYDDATQSTTIHGLVVLDLDERTIVGTLDAAEFPVPHALPDHVSTSASGRHAVVSWLAGEGGTVAYARDFSSSRVLTQGSEHSDLAFGPDHEDYLLYADYTSGALVALDLDTGESFELRSLYPEAGESYALHVSGQAHDAPGWAVVSTYADSADYGATAPAPTLRPEYRKVWLVELVPDGRVLNVVHTRLSETVATDYFAEPQATVSRDLSRILVASDLGSGTIEDYLIGLPSWVRR